MIRKLIAGVAAGAALAAPLALAAPAQASTGPDNLVAALVGASGPSAGTPDANSRDFDILISLAGDAGLVPTLESWEGTVFAPADASFRGLVADLTNTFPWRLDEATVLATVRSLGVGAVGEVLKYHVTEAQIPRLSQAPSEVETLSALGDGDFQVKKSFLTSFKDNDDDDLNPFWTGQTIRAKNGGTAHVIAGVLRPIDFAALGLKD
jgi:uncharacterized surface protein with fasciclin (FAS1) repeats